MSKNKSMVLLRTLKAARPTRTPAAKKQKAMMSQMTPQTRINI